MFRRLLCYGAALFAASLAILAAAAWSVLTLPGETRLLRREIAAAVPLETVVQIDAGRWVVALARIGIAFAPEVPAEARRGLACVERGSVGVYRLGAEVPAARVTERLRTCMKARGWAPLAIVRGNQETVIVFSPEKPETGSLRVAAAVLKERDLVLVSGSLSTDGLEALVESLPRDLPLQPLARL